MSQTSQELGGFMSRISGDIWRYCGLLALPHQNWVPRIKDPYPDPSTRDNFRVAWTPSLCMRGTNLANFFSHFWPRLWLEKKSNTCLAGNPNWLAEKSPKTSINSQTKHDVWECPKRRRCWCRRASSVISKRSLSQIRCVLTLSKIASSQAAPSGRAFDGWTKMGLQPRRWENKVVDVTVGVG